MVQYLHQQLLLLLLARNGGKLKSGWACALLMEMHTLYISNITFSLPKSNAKDTLGLKTKMLWNPKVRGDQEPLTQQWHMHFGFALQQQSPGTQRPWGMSHCCRDICTRCLGHWASNIREKQPFVLLPSNSAAWKDCQLCYFGLCTHQQA